MKNTLYFEEFQTIVAEILGINQDVIKKDSLIYQDIGLDSLGVVNLIVRFQKQHEISIPPAIILEAQTVGELYNAIKEFIESNPVVY